MPSGMKLEVYDFLSTYIRKLKCAHQKSPSIFLPNHESCKKYFCIVYIVLLTYLLVQLDNINTPIVWTIKNLIKR